MKNSKLLKLIFYLVIFTGLLLSESNLYADAPFYIIPVKVIGFDSTVQSRSLLLYYNEIIGKDVNEDRVKKVRLSHDFSEIVIKRSGIITDINAILYSEPSVNSEKLKHFKVGESFDNVIERTKVIYSIGGPVNYWYKVALDSGKVGWVLDDYINLSDNYAVEISGIKEYYLLDNISMFISKNGIPYLNVSLKDNKYLTADINYLTVDEIIKIVRAGENSHTSSRDSFLYAIRNNPSFWVTINNRDYLLEDLLKKPQTAYIREDWIVIKSLENRWGPHGGNIFLDISYNKIHLKEIFHPWESDKKLVYELVKAFPEQLDKGEYKFRYKVHGYNNSNLWFTIYSYHKDHEYYDPKILLPPFLVKADLSNDKMEFYFYKNFNDLSIPDIYNVFSENDSIVLLGDNKKYHNDELINMSFRSIAVYVLNQNTNNFQILDLIQKK